MTQGALAVASTIVASVIGILSAIITNYYVTQDTIDAAFRDWQAKLEITAREDERRSQVDQIIDTQRAFHLHLNHLRQYNEISFEFYLNEAIVSHQPLFAFGGLSEAKAEEMVASLESNIQQALSRRFQLSAAMASSDAHYKSAMETIFFRHSEDCVAALSEIPNLVQGEINEAEAYFSELSPYIRSQSHVAVARSEFMEKLTSTRKHQAAFSFDRPISSFSEAAEKCHSNLRAIFTSFELEE